MAKKEPKDTAAVRDYQLIGMEMQKSLIRFSREHQRLARRRMMLWKRMTEEQRKAADFDLWFRLKRAHGVC